MDPGMDQTQPPPAPFGVPPHLDVGEVNAVEVAEHLADLGRVLEHGSRCLCQVVQGCVAPQGLREGPGCCCLRGNCRLAGAPGTLRAPPEPPRARHSAPKSPLTHHDPLKPPKHPRVSPGLPKPSKTPQTPTLRLSNPPQTPHNPTVLPTVPPAVPPKPPPKPTLTRTISSGMLTMAFPNQLSRLLAKFRIA